MRFKMDENLTLEVAELLWAVDYDAMMVTEQELRGEDDALISEACLREGRALVTLDLDFSRLSTALRLLALQVLKT
jgi:predicted nuclease of predicted toxin-antitoxin system